MLPSANGVISFGLARGVHSGKLGRQLDTPLVWSGDPVICQKLKVAFRLVLSGLESTALHLGQIVIVRADGFMSL